MHSSLTAIVLCLCAQVATAQCVDSAPVANDARMGAEVIKTSAKAVVATPTPTRQGGELIKTAAAGTRTPTGPREQPVVRDNATMKADEEHPPRSGTAMLLAALALMSGIALRRFGANQQ